MTKEELFAKCVFCGCTVYTDGMGDDVIPEGYLTDEGWVCEDCRPIDMGEEDDT